MADHFKCEVKDLGWLEAKADSAEKRAQNAPGVHAAQTSQEMAKASPAMQKLMADSGKSRLVAQRARDVDMLNVEWMWRNRFPKAMCSLVAGHGDLGKTTLLLGMAAIVTCGAEWPDGSGRAEQGSVIYFAGEDTLEHILTPRFVAAGGDRDRMFFVRAVRTEDEKGRKTFDLGVDLIELEKLIMSLGDVRLVIFDPINSYFGKADTYKSAQVSGARTLGRSACTPQCGGDLEHAFGEALERGEP